MEKPVQPRWETAVLLASFFVLWIWFLVRHATLSKPGTAMSPLWQVVLVGLLVAMAIVTVRRMRRVIEALREAALPPNRRVLPTVHRNGHSGPRTGV